MRRFQAMLTALVLAILTSAGIILFAGGQMELNHREVGVWMSDCKYLSREGVVRNLDENTLLVFGSSEFEHGRSSEYHIANQFQEDSMIPFLIGKNQCQSLQHAILLASVEPSMENRKVVLIASPQWFQRKRVIPQSFVTRFSMDHFQGMLENETLSQETKERMILRCETLLEKSDEKMYQQVCYAAEQENSDTLEITGLYWRLRARVNHWQNGIAFALHARSEGISGPEKKESAPETDASASDPHYDWKQLYKDAETEAKKNSDNDFCMNNIFYRLNKGKILASKGKCAGRRFFENAEEYGDYSLFLDVCKELGIEVMVIVPGNNAYWTDYTEYPEETLENTYHKMIQVAKDHGAKVCDLTAYSREPYFFMDNFHFSQKGWVKLNEAIENFYREN